MNIETIRPENRAQVERLQATLAKISRIENGESNEAIANGASNAPQTVETNSRVPTVEVVDTPVVDLPTQGATPQKEVVEVPKEAVEAPKEVSPTALYDKDSPILLKAKEEALALANSTPATPQTLDTTSQAMKELEELKQENERLKAEILAKTKEDDFAKVENNLQNFIENEDLDESVRDSLKNVMEPVIQQQKALREELNKIREASKPMSEAELKQQKINQTSIAVRQQVPELDYLLKSTSFGQYLSQKDDRVPSLRKGEVMQFALERGDVQFLVNELVTYINGGKQQDVASIADIGATNGVGTEPNVKVMDEGTSKKPKISVGEARQKFFAGELTREQYSALLKEILG